MICKGCLYEMAFLFSQFFRCWIDTEALSCIVVKLGIWIYVLVNC